MKGLWPFVKVVAGVGILVALVVRLGAQAFVDGLTSIGVGRCSRRSLSACSPRRRARRAGASSRAVSGCGCRWPPRSSDCYRAVFLNSVLPAGVLGDVHRAVGYGRSIGDVGRGVRVVAIERVTGRRRSSSSGWGCCSRPGRRC